MDNSENKDENQDNVKNERMITKACPYNLQAQSDKLAQGKKLDETKRNLFVPKNIDARTSARLPKVRWATKHERQHPLHAEINLIFF